MALIKTIAGHTPIIDPAVWLAENATITGNVIIGHGSSIWYNVVIRGDVNPIVVGDRVNVQDGSIVHGSTGGPPTVIGDDVSIGHRAIIHGCVIHAQALIGMGAIILDGAVIESHAMVAAGAVVTSGTVVESGYIYAGTPARKLKPLTQEQIQSYIHDIGAGYVAISKLQ